VLAINDAYRLAPWADVLYAADQGWWKWHQGVPSFTGPKYAMQAGAAEWGVTVLRNTGDEGLERDPCGLRNGRNGGYQAINLAVHLGATRIVLLGYDMQAFKGQPSHWFGEHPDGNRAPYDTYRHYFQTIVAPLQALGVTVLNASRTSALDCFPRVSLAEALA